MAAAQGTKKVKEEDEMLAKAIALSLEDVEDKQVRKAINLSMKVENKPVPLFPGNHVPLNSSMQKSSPNNSSVQGANAKSNINGTSVTVTKIHPTIFNVHSPPPPHPPSLLTTSSTTVFRTMKRPDGEAIVEFPPNPSRVSPKDLTEQSLVGTVTGINIEKSFGFIASSKSLSKEYTGKSLFFHFTIVKNLSEKSATLQKGSTVKFILYKGSYDKPKAFAVFLLGQDSKNGKNVKTKATKEGKKPTVKANNGPGLDQIKKQLENKGSAKKVSIFWDIENCRPKKNSILQVVGKIRELVLQGQQEQSFMVVCDVTEESKDVISSLEDANVDVRHISRSKKDSSDEVLRQEMRKVVDTSSEPGRIVLISGDCDFSKDLHGFRYRKSYEIVLIHNAMAKPALIQCANLAFQFETVLSQFQVNGEKKGKKGEKKKGEKKKKEKEAYVTCQSGHKLSQKTPDNSGWFCDASQEDGGCKRALTFGGNSSAKFPYHHCKDCDYSLCDLCGQARKQVAIPAKAKKASKNAEKLNTKNKKVKCISGHVLTFMAPDGIGSWFCNASTESRGCKRNLTFSGTTNTNISGNFPHFNCGLCSYNLCDLCCEAKKGQGNGTQVQKGTKATKGKPQEQKSNKKIVQNKDKMVLIGNPSITNDEIVNITKDIVTSFLSKGDGKSLEAASAVVARKFHKTTIGELVENLFIEILEKNPKTRISGGNLFVLLLRKDLLDQSCLVQTGLNNMVMNTTDMLSVIPDVWDFLADILSPLFCTGALPLRVLKDSKTMLSEEMIGKYLSSVLNQMGKSVGHLKVKKLWRDSDLDWPDFVDNIGTIQVFVHVHKLEWLGLGTSLANFSSSSQDLAGIELGTLGSSSSLQDAASLISFESEEDDTSSESEDESQSEDEDEENLIVLQDDDESLISF